MSTDKRPIKERDPVHGPFGGSDDAIDDTDDLDDDFVEIQKTISNSRARNNKNGDNKIQEVLPFQFLPNIRPLTVSDLDSCVALEDAAFTDPAHRCSREKASEYISIYTHT